MIVFLDKVKYMSAEYPVLDGGPLISLSNLGVLWRRIKLKFFGLHGNALCVDISDNQKDAVMEFDEFPRCKACGSTDAEEVLKAVDGNRIVEFKNCGLWFTSPRVNEAKWVQWLAADNERNAEFTENRLRHGVALSRNIPYSFSFWWRITRAQRQKQIKKLKALHGGRPNA